VFSLLFLSTLCSGAWQPAPGLSFNWILQGTVDVNADEVRGVNVVDIDMFAATPELIAALHANGKGVVCYISSQFEDWRSDAAQFPAAALGNVLDDWPGEKWLDVRDANVRSILAARVTAAAAKKCDAVEWDNIDVDQHETGFPLEFADTLSFLTFLSQTTRAAGMAVGLKNYVEQMAALAPLFDFAVNEQCFEYDECDDYKTYFTSKGKAVFNCEYEALNCAKAAALGMTSVKKALDLKSLPFTLCNEGSFDPSRRVVATDSSTPVRTSRAGTSTPLTQELSSCSVPWNLSGSCMQISQCTGTAVAARDGATGCESEPADVRCCVKATPCSAHGKSGTCRNTSDCAKGGSVPASAGATGCNALPAAVQCCIRTASASRLEDEQSSMTTSGTPPAPAFALAALAVSLSAAATLLK
jgi:hypothetical protein